MKNRVVIIIMLSMFLLSAQISVSAINICLKTNDYGNKENSPPNNPIILVPDKIPRGKWFEIQVEITDPDGDDLYLRFDSPIFPGLPSFWFGPISSPIKYDSWVNYRGPVGEYTIGVQAKDIFEAESQWTYVQFNITKSKTLKSYHYNFFQTLMEKFLNINNLIELFI